MKRLVGNEHGVTLLKERRHQYHFEPVSTCPTGGKHSILQGGPWGVWDKHLGSQMGLQRHQHLQQSRTWEIEGFANPNIYVAKTTFPFPLFLIIKETSIKTLLIVCFFISNLGFQLSQAPSYDHNPLVVTLHKTHQSQLNELLPLITPSS